MSVIAHGVRAVFFDAVGTLLFPAVPPADTYAAAARRQGVALDPSVILPRFLTAFRAEEDADRATGWVTSEKREAARWQRIVATSLPELPDPARGFAELFAHFARPDAWTVHPDAATVLADLTRRGIVVGIGSNLDARLFAVVNGTPELEAVRGLVVVSGAIGHRKPSPKFFDAVVAATGCEPHEIAFVGDDVANDYEGATAAGMTAVHLRHPDRLRDVIG